MDFKRYVLTNDCFVGKKGDIVLIDWDGYDGAIWKNISKDTMGKPFIETDCIKEDFGGDCIYCGMAYSFVFGFQPHKANCKRPKEVSQ